MSLEQSILDKIKEKGLKPRARWRFRLKNCAIWSLGLLSLVVGSLAVAVILYMLSFNDWGIRQELDQSLLSYLVISLPYFWLAFLGLFIWAVYYNFKQTKHGYRYHLSAVAGLSILASVLIGAFFFRLGLGATIDDVLSRKAPYYDGIINHKMVMWRRPDDGRLAGMVVEKRGDTLLVVFAMDQSLWQIDIASARIMAEEPPSAGKPIKAIGRRTGERLFQADLVMPFGPGRDFFRRERPIPCPMAGGACR